MFITILTPPEAADYLGISERTLQRWSNTDLTYHHTRPVSLHPRRKGPRPGSLFSFPIPHVRIGRQYRYVREKIAAYKAVEKVVY